MRADLADRTKNPTKNVAVANNLGGALIFLTIRAQRSLNVEDIYDALETKFGAGKIAGDKDTATQGAYVFTILP